MPIDTCYVSALCGELDRVAKGARINKIFMPGRDEILLQLGGAGKNIFLSVAGGSARVLLTDERGENPLKPPAVCMALRKHIGGGRILSVAQPVFDRVVEIKIECLDEMFDRSVKKLYFELMGSRSNVIITDEQNVIIEALRKNDLTDEVERRIMPGLIYTLPKPPKPVPLTDKEKVARLFDEQNDEQPLEKLLMQKINGISPLLAREAVFRAFGDAEAKTDRLADGKDKIVRVLHRLADRVQNGDFESTVLKEKDGRPKDVCAFDLLQYGDIYLKQRCDSPSAAAELFFSERAAAEKKKQLAGALEKKIRHLKEKAEKKKQNFMFELKDSRQREHFRVFAELISANVTRIARGLDSIELENWYDEMKPIKVPLDPKKSPQLNADAYYKKYRKAKNAEAQLVQLIDAADREIEYFDSVALFLEQASTEEEVAQIREELAAGKYIKLPSAKRAKRKTGYNYAKFKTSDGFFVLAGRNNAQNDALSFREAGKRDIWLHAQNYTGSHVILFCDGQYTDRALEQAAVIAATMSSASGGGKIPIQYTPAGILKKPSGAKPGFVTFKSYRTILAEGNAELVEKLKIKN